MNENEKILQELRANFVECNMKLQDALKSSQEVLQRLQALNKKADMIGRSQYGYEEWEAKNTE